MADSLKKRIDALYNTKDESKIEAFKRASGADVNFSPSEYNLEAYKLGIESFLKSSKIDLDPRKIVNPNTYKGFVLAYLRDSVKNERTKQKLNEHIVDILENHFSFVTEEGLKEANQFVKGMDIAKEYFHKKEIDDFQATLAFIKFPKAEILPNIVIENLLEEYNSIFKDCTDFETDSYFSFVQKRFSESLGRLKKVKSAKEASEYLDRSLFLLYWLSNDSFVLDQPFDTQKALEDWKFAAYEVNKRLNK